MNYKYSHNKNLLNYSRQNRKAQTKAEKILWYHLRNRFLNGYKFRRQYPVLNYILDFYCIEKKLAVELDGSQHVERKEYDKKREKDLERIGIKIVRFWDNEVLVNIKAVLEKLLEELERRKTSP